MVCYRNWSGRTAPAVPSERKYRLTRPMATASRFLWLADQWNAWETDLYGTPPDPPYTPESFGEA